jgi:hypothetical protein
MLMLMLMLMAMRRVRTLLDYHAGMNKLGMVQGFAVHAELEERAEAALVEGVKQLLRPLHEGDGRGEEAISAERSDARRRGSDGDGLERRRQAKSAFHPRAWLLRGGA